MPPPRPSQAKIAGARAARRMGRDVRQWVGMMVSHGWKG
jgi:hypothetical protein